jgi:hypothetical protein
MLNETIIQSSQQTSDNDGVLRLADVELKSVSSMLSGYGLALKTVPTGSAIPGSYWGDEEAGLIGNELLVSADTPLHSILHEACHYVCMDQARREGVHTDAGGDYDEENAVCYLQILLADHIEHFGKQRMFEDMDRWGYTFRLGSAQAWFERDAEETRVYLLNLGLTNKHDQPTFKLREL